MVHIRPTIRAAPSAQGLAEPPRAACAAAGPHSEPQRRTRWRQAIPRPFCSPTRAGCTARK
eukprot:scaffold219749_cov28-Tisochrysis_lutea.AAC.3